VELSQCDAIKWNRYNPLQAAQAAFASPGRGLMVFEYIIRSSPRRRASPCLAEGFSPTASPAYRMNCSKTISPIARPGIADESLRDHNASATAAKATCVACGARESELRRG